MPCGALEGAQGWPVKVTKFPARHFTQCPAIAVARFRSVLLSLTCVAQPSHPYDCIVHAYASNAQEPCRRSPLSMHAHEQARTLTRVRWHVHTYAPRPACLHNCGCRSMNACSSWTLCNGSCRSSCHPTWLLAGHIKPCHAPAPARLALARPHTRWHRCSSFQLSAYWAPQARVRRSACTGHAGKGMANERVLGSVADML